MSAREQAERSYLTDLLDSPLGEVGGEGCRVLFFATPVDEIPIAYYITIGFGESVELGLLVGERHRTFDEHMVIARAMLASTHALAAEPGALVPEQVVPTPAFESTFPRRSHSYLTDFTADSPTYIPVDDKRRARLLLLNPVYDEERRWIGTMSQQQVLRAFADADARPEYPGRGPLRVQVGPKILNDEMSKTRDFKKLFDALMTWGAERKARVGELESPAKDASITALSTTLGQEVPDDLLQSLQASDGGARLGNFFLLDAGSIASTYKARLALVDQPSTSDSESCKHVKWSKGWIPFAEDGGRNLRCIDLDPGPKGAAGQVIWWDAEMGKAGATKFDSFGEWLEAAITDCTSGKATVEENGMVDLSDAMR